MKKEIIYYLVLIFAITSLIFFETNISEDEGLQISKVIDIETFEKLDIDLKCNIYVSIGDEQRVVLEGPENYLNMIEATLENGILKLTTHQPGILNGLLTINQKEKDPINIYLKLTSAQQLICPTKGTLITNESALYDHIKNQVQLSFNQHLYGILKLMGSQTGFIPKILY